MRACTCMLFQLNFLSIPNPWEVLKSILKNILLQIQFPLSKRFHVATHEAFAVVCTRGGVFPSEALQISVRLQVPSESWSCFTGVAKVIWWEGNALVICC